jgi:hypothetical protein
VSTLPDSATLPGAGTLKRLPRAGRESWLGRSARSLWERWNSAQAFVAPPREEWPIALRRARIAGLAFLGLELILLCWWSAAIANRYALTLDFSTFEQAVSRIAGGNLDPRSTTLGVQISHGVLQGARSELYFWQDHSEFIFWPFAALQWLWPHPETLLWIQDLATVAGETVAFLWMCDIAARRARVDGTVALPVGLTVTGLVLLVANPWVIWASSFDVHTEAFGMLFAVATARDLYRGRRRAWLWFALGLACGDVGGSYQAAVGLSAMLCGRRWLRQGAAMFVGGIAWILLLGAIHGSMGTRVGETYPNLIDARELRNNPNAPASTLVTALLSHPGRGLSALWSNRLQIWSNLSPSGVFGLLWLPTLVPALMVLLEGQLSGMHDFSFPGFQQIALYVFAAVGTVGLCAALSRTPVGRRRWVMPVVLGVLLINALGWAAVWIPQTSTRWLRVSTSAASLLRGVQAKIGPQDEVVAQQGVAGAFADRASIYPFLGGDIRVPVQARKLWVILAPNQGIEGAPVSQIYADVAALTADPQIRKVTGSDGIWAFEWTAPKGARWFTVSTPKNPVTPAWTVPGVAGNAVQVGPENDWYTAGNGRAGYVVDGDYWRERPGDYSVAVRMAVSSSANVELWNSTTGTLLQRLSVPGTNGPTTVRLDAKVDHTPAEQVYTGWGPWRQGGAPPTGDQFEVRVWSPGGDDEVDVYSVSLQKVR